MDSQIRNLAVAIASGAVSYPARPPFHPPEVYPEIAGINRSIDPTNDVFPMVRESMRLLGLDSERYGTPGWNPLGGLISRGQRVLIKPNFVMHRNFGDGPIEAVITHGSVLRAVADYVLIALRGHGDLIIGDAPQMNCDFALLRGENGMNGVASYLGEITRRMGVSFQLLDFRQEQTYYWRGIVWRRRKLRDGNDHTVDVELCSESFLDSVDEERLYGADYDRKQTVEAHRNHKHRYRIAKEVLNADVLISVPKLKVHSKVGTTLNLKNMVGINTDKNHLAHYRVGPPELGGDEFSNPRWDDRLDRKLSDLLLGANWALGKYPFVTWRCCQAAIRKIWRKHDSEFSFGNWHGNDTAWRMALDLNRILLTADRNGRLQPSPCRTYFSFIDGIIGGQGNGPLHPDAHASGVLLAGFNPLATDWVATRLMGIDPFRIPMYARAVDQMQEWLPFKPEAIRVRSNVEKWKDVLTRQDPILKYAPAPGWKGVVELRGERELTGQGALRT